MPDPITRLNAALEGRYRIERQLGEGGMATVYLAEDLKHDRKVALKVLKPELTAALGRDRFHREIRVTANLHHPHILPLHDSGDAAGALFYVTPLVRGESLRERLSREKMLPVDETLRIIGQVAAALDFAHREGVVHRDIKPANILLQDGEALLADFGIAIGPAETGGGRFTGTGLSLGTPTYMSPEQATGDGDVDARSDVYSLGAVAYEMLAGEPPVTGSTPQAMLAKLVTERPTSLRVVREAVPVEVDAAVQRALAKVPADRFSTARDFADALGRSAAGPYLAPDGAARMRSRRRVWAAGLAVVGALGLAAIATYAVSLRDASGGAGRPRADIRSIAVLPLDNYSGDPAQDYFAEGMTDELTAALATISALRVISRGSAMRFGGRDRPATPEIARILNVDAVVEGSVVRSGDRVRITAQLIDARADEHLWAQSFERSSNDVLALQADLASAIAREINVRLTEGEESRFAAAPSVDPRAHDAYLRGRYYMNRPSDENLRRAIEEFQNAVALDPTFASAYSGLSDAYLFAGYNEGFMTASAAKPLAREAAETAVALDGGSAEAHASLAVFRVYFELDWRGAEVEFRRAIALNPSYTYAHGELAYALALLGRYEESEAEGRLAAELDPMNPQVAIYQAGAPAFQGDIDEAVAFARRATELDPTYFGSAAAEGHARLQVGQFEEAVPFFERARSLGGPPWVTAYLAYAHAAAGDRANALLELDALHEASLGGEAAPFSLAIVYVGLEDHDRALEELERARDAGSTLLAWLGQDAIFDPMRGDPRFVALLRELGFPD